MSTLKVALMSEDFPEPLCDYEWYYQIDLSFSCVTCTYLPHYENPKSMDS